jgi:hypothetical protein
MALDSPKFKCDAGFLPTASHISSSGVFLRGPIEKPATTR